MPPPLPAAPPPFPRGFEVARVAVTEPPPPPPPVVESPVVESPIVESPVVESPIVESPVVESPVVESPVVESPVVESPVVESPVVESPVVESPIVESPIVEPPVVEPPAPVESFVAPLPAAAEEPPVALPSVPAPAFDPAGSVAATYSAEPHVVAPTPVFVPASLPPSPLRPPPAALSVGERLAGAQSRLVTAIPPHWLELLRKQPVLWMVVTPVVLATLLILIAVALAPDVEKASPEPPARAAAAMAPSAQPAAAESPPAAHPPADSATIAALESKSPDALSVDEVLLVKQHRADQKRSDAQGLATKLQQQPELAKDSAVQRELLRLAADPDTSELALTAMARSPSSTAKDLLYDVSTSRAVPQATSELAHSLLSSRDVRAHTSPALAVALDLRAAADCEAARAALPRAQSEGDRRSLAWLGRLNSRRGCGTDKTEDCYACLRPQMKQVTAAINAVKRRKAPSSVPY